MTAPHEAPPGADPTAGRQAWLERTGPHALLRTVRSGDPLIASLTVRPGALTNTLSAIDVRFHSDAGAVVVPVPVFATYRRQWTLDLTAAVPAAALAPGHTWQAEVVLTSYDGDPVVLPVRQAGPDAFSLAGTPELTDTPWTLAPGPEATRS